MSSLVPFLDRAARLGPALVLLLAAVLGIRRLDNTDTWWHLAAGRWIVHHRSIPALDPLSSTVPDHRWINVQWLFDVVLYGLHQLGGPDLLVVASALAYTGAVALLLVNLRRHVGDVATTVLGLAAVLVAQERFAIRPEMATYLLLQVLLWLYATGREPTSRRLWLVPAVMCVWANCHSLFSVGVVVIACQIAGTLLGALPVLPAGWRTPLDAGVRRRIVASGLAGVATTAVNPFGLDGALFPVMLLSRFTRENPSFRSIGEFQPPFSSYFVTLSITVYQVMFVASLVVVGAALAMAAIGGGAGSPRAGAARAQRRRTGAPAPAPVPQTTARPLVPPLDLADVAVFVGVAYLSVLARRNTALFALAGAPCVARALAVLASRLPEAAGHAARAVERALGVVLASGAAVAVWWVVSNGFYRWNDDMHEFGLGVFPVRAPIRAAAFVRAQGLPGPWFNDLSTGGYFTWDPPIDGGVYVDGRLEVYEAPFLDAYVRQLGHPPAWQAEMDRRGVQTAVLFHWWPNVQPLVRHLTSDARWALVYYDENVLVAVRRAGNDAAIVRAQAALPAARAATEQFLLEPSPAWQYPVGRARGLRIYASLLERLGRRDEAARFRERLADL